MANLKYSQLVTLIANDLGKTERVTDVYIKGILNRILKELTRNNTVTIEYFGTFTPAFRGKYEIDEITKKPTFIADAKLDIDFNLTESGKAFLNKDVDLTDEERKDIENKELRKIKKYKKIILGLKKEEDLAKVKIPLIVEKKEKEKPPLEEVFNKVINQIKERNSDLLDESEDIEDYGEEDDI